jgi:Zn-finger nucleic acid-binding protein
MARQEKGLLTRELSGVLYLSASILLACSLLSYDFHDLRFFRDPPTAQNWIGIAGAWIGFLSYSLVGWSANLIPMTLAFLGVSALFRERYRLRHSAFWMLSFVLCMACLVQVLGWGNLTWSRHNNVFFDRQGAIGGAIGFWIGQKFFWTFLRHGAVIVFFFGSIASLFMALQVKPSDLWKRILELRKEWREWRHQEALDRGDMDKVIRHRQAELAERARALEKEIFHHERGAEDSRSREEELADRKQVLKEQLERGEKKSKAESRRAETEPQSEMFPAAHTEPAPKSEPRLTRPARPKPSRLRARPPPVPIICRRWISSSLRSAMAR